MKRKKTLTKKLKNLDIFSTSISKKINIKDLKVPPIFSLDETKKKKGNFYYN